MKYLTIFLIAFLGMSVSAQSQDAISKYFEKHMDDENFTVVYISAKMFQLLGKLEIDELDDGETQAVLEVVKDMRGLRVLTTDVNAKQMYDEAKATINTKGYEVLMTVRDEGDDVQFLIKDSGDMEIINELLLLVGSEEEFVMVSFVGMISLDKISKLANVLDVEGAEHLDKLEEREEN